MLLQKRVTRMLPSLLHGLWIILLCQFPLLGHVTDDLHIYSMLLRLLCIFFNALGYMLLARNSILSKNTNSLSFGVFTQSTSRGQTANLRPPERSITRCSSRSQQIISGTADALYPPCHTLEMSPVKTSPRWHVYNSAGVILSTRSPRSVVSLTVKRQNPFLRRAGTACS